MTRHNGLAHWTPRDLPDLSGKTYVITGANSGIGLEAARYLSEAGGDVVMVCRSRARGRKAQQVLQPGARGRVDLLLMDLSDLGSVLKAAAELRTRVTSIDGLINNAGIMMTPKTTTVDGFDLQMGTNHLGHFLWAGLLMDLVESAAGRVVVVSSLVHKLRALDLDDFMSERKYTPIAAYTQSKLANLMFAFELDRRLAAARFRSICVACHPGYSATELQSTGPRGLLNLLMKISNPLVAQSAAQGAISTVLAAAGDEAKRGRYYGPQKWSEYRGPVGEAIVAEHARSLEQQRRLWEVSERLVGFEWDLPAA